MKNLFLKTLTIILTLVLVLTSLNINTIAAKPSKDIVELTIKTLNPDNETEFTLNENTTQDIKVMITATSIRKVDWTNSDNLTQVSLDIKTGIAVYSYLAPSVDEDETNIATVKVVDSKHPEGRVLTLTFNIKNVDEPTVNEPPVAQNLLLEIEEDSEAVSKPIQATDPEGDTLFGKIVKEPSLGTVVLEGLVITYTPLSNLYGIDEFEVLVSDENGESDVSIVTVIINGVDDLPIAMPDVGNGYVNEEFVINVLNNDIDIDGGIIEIVDLINVENGTATEVEGVVTFIPTTDFMGEAGFDYVLNGSSLAHVTIFINTLPTETIKYVALGDSIPFGRYNTSIWNYLMGGTDTDSHVEQFASYLGDNVEFFDKSVSGYKTIDVLNQITDQEALLAEADVITLCIGANDIMDAASRSFSGLSKYDINWAIAESGRNDFLMYWSQVINGIEDINSDVTLIVMTIYNPYRITDSYYGLVDPYFTSATGDLGLNYIINNTESLYGDLFGKDFDYRVADIYSAFNATGNKDSLTGFYNSFCDPHPNQFGQNLIYEEYKRAYIQ